MLHGIGNAFNNFDINLGKTQTVANTTNTASSKPIELVRKTGSADFASNLGTISGKAKVNSPAAQGLASAENIEKGQLVSGYYFNNLEPHNEKLFALKYNNTNTPQVAQGTNYACEGIEYARIAGNLQNSPFAELFN